MVASAGLSHFYGEYEPYGCRLTEGSRTHDGGTGWLGMTRCMTVTLLTAGQGQDDKTEPEVALRLAATPELTADLYLCSRRPRVHTVFMSWASLFVLRLNCKVMSSLASYIHLHSDQFVTQRPVVFCRTCSKHRSVHYNADPTNLIGKNANVRCKMWSPRMKKILPPPLSQPPLLIRKRIRKLFIQHENKVWEM